MSLTTSGVTTRSQSQAVVHHIVGVVFGQPLDGDLQKSLDEFGYDQVEDILALSQPDIEALGHEMTNEEGNLEFVSLVRGKQNLIKAFQHFIRDLINQNLFTSFTDLTSDDFNEFRIRRYNPNQTLPPVANAPSSAPANHLTIVGDFRKSIKRDKSHYNVFKEDKQWDNWRRFTLATARAHGCEDVFDPTYTPATAADRAIFDEKLKFIYSVFEDKLRTDMGKYFVRQHELDYDAQKIFKKLQDHARVSTQASIDTADLLSYITSVKLHDSKWRGTAHSFILHWCDRVRAYEDMISTSDHFSDHVKMTMLQNTVTGVSELHQVKVQSSHDVAHGGQPLTFEKYKTLLLSAASVYDSQKGLARPKTVHRVQFTEQDDAAPSDSLLSMQTHVTMPPDDDVHDIDTDFNTLGIHVTKRLNCQPSFQPSMSKEKWEALSPDEQKAWDTLSDKAKATILGYGMPQRPPPTPTPRHINLTDISDADYFRLVAQHQQQASAHANPPIPEEAPSTPTETDVISPAPATDSDSSTSLLACATRRSAPPGDIRRVLGTPPSTKPVANDEMVINGKRYRRINVHQRITYNISNIKDTKLGSLVDRGANGGLAGGDVRIIHKDESPRLVDVSGIDSHQVTNLPIVTVGGVVPSQRGPVIAIMHQYAYMGSGKTIHSSAQLEHFKNDVNDKSLHVSGGLQRIHTNDGYTHPLHIHHGLPYISMRPFTDDEWDTLPHVVWTSDVEWDPSVLDCNIEDQPDWHESISDLEGGIIHSPFDEYGNYRHRTLEIHLVGAGEESLDGHELDLESHVDMIVAHHSILQFQSHQLHCNNKLLKAKSPNYEALRPFFLNASADIVRHTFQATTQFAHSAWGGSHLKMTYHSPFPALNVHRRHEAVATDTVYSDVPAVDNGCTAAQLFIGRDSLVTDVYGVKTDKQFINTLEDNIRKRGAMDKLISD